MFIYTLETTNPLQNNSVWYGVGIDTLNFISKKKKKNWNFLNIYII